jgi:hypothetical protein
MTAIPHEPMGQRQIAWYRVTEMWASLAITAMWVAVVVTAIVGPNIDSSTPGGTTSSVPSAVAVALFATIGTWAVARYGLRPRSTD